MNKHIKHIDIMDYEIIFELNWKAMIELSQNWLFYLIREFESNAVFSEFESVVVNKKFKTIQIQEKYTKEKREKNKKEKKIEREQIFMIKKIPTVITTKKTVLKKNEEIEKAIKKMLIKRDLVPEAYIKKIIFIKTNIQNVE